MTPFRLALSFNVILLGALGLACLALWRRCRILTAAQEEEAPYRMVFEQSKAAMLIIDTARGAIVDANEAAVAFYGWSRPELLGKLIQDINIQPAHQVREEMARADADGRTHFEFRHRQASGTVRDVEVFSGAVTLKGRRQLFSIIHDVTERKQAEAAMRESEEKFALTFAHAPTLMTLSEVDTGVYLDVNEAFLRISGYTREESLGRTSIEVGWVSARGRALMKQELAEKGHIQGLTIEAVAKDGRKVICLLNAELVPIRGHKFLLSAALDITSLVKAQRQLQRAQKMDSLGNLAGGVAHDMNNVLGAILALASAQVEAHPEGSTTYRAFDTISQAAQRGGEMVKRLLTFARTSPAEDQSVEVNGILKEAVRLLERTTLAKIRLELDLAEHLALVRGDAGALAHAFMNLCINAVDAMPDHGTLTLRTRNAAGPSVEVTVADTGTGMAKAVLDRALDPYFTTKPEGRGTGLGLTLVYSTVKAHRGEMELSSEVGRGTSIRLRFPASEPEPRLVTPEGGPSDRTAQGALSVLLVDDDELLQSSITMMLESMGHEVTTVGSGELALASLEAGLEPQVVILDLNMPGLGGAATLPRLRLLRPGTPIILATGRADQTALDLVESHTQVTLLPKPFGMKDLKAQFEAVTL